MRLLHAGWLCLVLIAGAAPAKQLSTGTTAHFVQIFAERLQQQSNNAHLTALLRTLSEQARQVSVLTVPATVYRLQDPVQVLAESPVSTDRLSKFFHLPAVWQRTQGKGVIVALVDTGIDWEHPALQSHLFINPAEDRNGNGRFDPWWFTEERDGISGDLDGIDDDGNGVVDDVMGYDFAESVLPSVGDWRNPDPVPEDEHGHGTAMAGVIVGGNDQFITGIAKSATLLPIRVFTAEGTGSDMGIAAGILYAIVMGADCINLSYGNYYLSPVVQLAIQVATNRGIVVVASAGNEGRSAFHFPSALNEVIAVAATTFDDHRAIFSNYGQDIDLAAPGVEVPTTERGGSLTLVSGTSVAAAIVTGAAALLRELHPQWSPQQIAQALAATAVDLGEPGWDPFFGAGRIELVSATALPAVGMVRILSPKHLSVIHRFRSSEIPVQIIADDPQLVSAKVVLYRREAEGEFVLLDTLCVLQRCLSCQCPPLVLSSLTDGEYLIEVRAMLVTGQQLRVKARFTLVSGAPVLSFVQVLPVWDGKRRAVVVEAVTDLPALMAVRWRQSLQEAWIEQFIADRATRSHVFLLHPQRTGWLQLELRYWYPGQRDTVVTRRQISFQLQHFPRNTFQITGRAFAHPLYWMSDVGKESDTIVAVQLTPTLRFQQTLAFAVDASGQLHPIDSLEEIWIPKAIGDVDGDGRKEVLLHRGNQTRLMRETSRIFGTVLWESDTLWAAALDDVDSDGKDEVIVRSETAYLVGKLQQNTLQFDARLPNVSEPDPYFGRNFLGVPGVQTGDFDGDGLVELAFADSDGDVLIYQQEAGGWRLDTVIETGFWNSDGYLAAGDVDGDGVDELVVGYTTFLVPEGTGEALAPLWICRLYDGVAPNQYRQQWEDYFWGALPKTPFRSGIQCQDVNGDSRAELLLAFYPYLYVLQPQGNQFQPWFVLDSVAANTIWSDSLKVFVSRFRSVAVLQQHQPTARYAITGLQAAIVDSTTVQLWWDPLPVAQYTVVVRSADGMDTIVTAQPAIVVDSLQVGAFYTFRVSAADAIADTLQMQLRAAPRVREVFSVGAAALRIIYDAPIDPPLLNPRWVTLQDVQGRSFSPVTLAVMGSNVVVALFDSLASGHYKGSIASFADGYYGKTRPYQFSVQLPPEQERPASFWIVRGNYRSVLQIDLVFSSAVERESAENPERYTITPHRTVVSAMLQNDTTVRLAIDPSTPLRPIGKPYFVQARSVQSLAGDTLQPGKGDQVAVWVPTDGTGVPVVYPNPVSLSRDFVVTVSNVPDNGYGVVRSAAGELIVPSLPLSSTGTLQWYLSDFAIEPGVYIVEIYDANDRLVQRTKVLLLP